jgi:pilus assembly protein CpaB
VVRQALCHNRLFKTLSSESQMKSLNITLLLIVVIGGLAAAFQAGRLTINTDQPKTEQPQVEMVEVAVAKTDLPVGALLDESLLTLVKFPKATLPVDVICDIKDLKNKQANHTLKQGSYFSPSDVRECYRPKIPDGMFQYVISLGDKATNLQAGDRADVIFTERYPDGTSKSGMVLRDMLLLAVENETRDSILVQSVSLAVTTEQSLILAACERRGEVTLVWRDSKPIGSNQPIIPQRHIFIGPYRLGDEPSEVKPESPPEPDEPDRPLEPI